MFAKKSRQKTVGADRADTRKAILDAAAEMFAAHGYRAATIREICAAAGANIALVSRHFGSKQGRYAEVCRSLFNGIAASRMAAYGRESSGCALAPQSMRSAKAEAANMVRKGVLRGDLKDPRGEASKVLAKLGPPRGPYRPPRGHQHI